MRRSADGEDELLVDPLETSRGGRFAAVTPLRVSSDGRLLLYEVKEGGERTGTFELLEIETRRRLLDSLPRGYLRGFSFAPDSRSFYYVHESLDTKRSFSRCAYQHVLGTPSSEDRLIFFAGEDEHIRLTLLSGVKSLAFLVHRFVEKNFTDIYLRAFDGEERPQPLFLGIDYLLILRFFDNRIIALTDLDAPNRRIVEIHIRDNGQPELTDLVTHTDTLIHDWLIAGGRLLVSYVRETTHQIRVFDLNGKQIGEIPLHGDETVRMVAGTPESDDFLLETESFLRPITLFRCSTRRDARTLFAKRNIPLDLHGNRHLRTTYASKDGTRIPVHLVGRRDVLDKTGNPAILTAYGGHGIPVTPQFSVFVAFLIERGCLFALPNIRGGAEFGPAWHEAARRSKRQAAYDDFLSAAEWLIDTGRSDSRRLAIFGGSNSGLLVGAALTQRPELFRAVICMVPILDMLRYHLFDGAHVWKKEFGTVEDPDDFSVLARYSPYQRVRDKTDYPSTMIVSGDADQKCNPLHARKMTARLQAANTSDHPIILDYSRFRGHSPVLPFSERVDALTDRLAFLCDQLQLPA